MSVTTLLRGVPADAAQNLFQLRSEVDPLRRVLLHRPRHAAADHDVLVETLVGRGVEVLSLTDLLTDVVEDDVARAWLIDRTVRCDDHGPFLGPELIEHLHSLAPADLAAALIGGVTRGDLLFRAEGLRFATLAADDSVLAPLRDHYFVRDASIWVYGGVVLSPMIDPARHRETINLAAIYRFHPYFEGGRFHFWYDGEDNDRPPATLHGGDVVVVGDGVVVIGFGHFTSPAAVERFASALFGAGSAREVIALELPRDRRVHLDTLLTMVDHFRFAAGAGVGLLRCWSLQPGAEPGAVDVHRAADVDTAIATALRRGTLTIVTTSTYGNDVLAIAPGVVLSYRHNVDVNAALSRAGIEVIELPGRLLGPAHGGPRRVSCPLSRYPSD